jgi:hypothetical protein
MDKTNLDETRPTEVGQESENLDLPSMPSPEAEDAAKPKKRGAWIWWLLLALFLLIAVIALSGYLGYQEGIDRRTGFEITQESQTLKEQFDLGVQDMEAKRYEIARQRFEYVIEIDPNYPGVTEKLAEVLLAQNITATPTIMPTVVPTQPTSTPDLRGEAELFARAQDFIANSEWENAIETLEILRKKNVEYNAIDVDGMFYLSLRNQGVQKIGLGKLESGIYDLTLAESFGPLDTEADGLRTWARYYIAGASAWQVDWGQAAYFFGQVAPMTPNMHDGTGWTAAQRYLEALVHYGEWAMDNKEWCIAETQFKIALELGADPSLEESLALASIKCESAKEDEKKDDD